MPSFMQPSEQFGQGEFSPQNIPQLQENQAQNQPMTQPGMGQGNPAYTRAAVAAHMAGLPNPQIVESNGKYIAITPFGNYDLGVKGLSEKEKVLEHKDAEKISNLEDTIVLGSAKQETLSQLNNNITSEEFEAMRQHPLLGKHELGWYALFGTKEQQRLVGETQTYMNQIIKDSAQDFKGQFRIGEQALLNSMKPVSGDSLDVMKGKCEALTYLTNILMMRAEMEARYMRDYGMSFLDAKRATDNQIDAKAVKKQVHEMLYPSKPTPEGAQAELERRAGGR
jgi:hypothetical protein